MQAPVESMPSASDPRIAGQIGALLVLTALALAPLAVLIARRIFPGRNVTFARWGFSHVVQVLLLIVTLGWFCSVAWPAPKDAEHAPHVLLENQIRTAAILACAAVAIVRIARKMAPQGWRALGLAADGNARAIAAGLASYTLLLPGILGLGGLWTWLLSVAGVEVTGQEVLRQFLELPPGDVPLALVLGVIVGPFLEELIFRGFLQPLFVQSFSAKGGIAITSFLFAALHGVQAFLPVFGLSLVLGAVMLRTHRLAACWVVHAAHNGLMLAIAPELVRGAHQAGGLYGS